jgi:hypothetical protein
LQIQADSPLRDQAAVAVSNRPWVVSAGPDLTIVPYMPRLCCKSITLYSFLSEISENASHSH